jgi:uncharacterized protein YeaO (DUF488 family)
MPLHHSRLVLKRAYEPSAARDGRRVLVDRLWPRGVSKERLAIDEWMKDVAPSTKLRRWFGHDPEKWRTFQQLYRRELEAHADLVDRLARYAIDGRVTLIFGARDESHNDAVVLAAVVRRRMGRIRGGRRRAVSARRAAGPRRMVHG